MTPIRGLSSLLCALVFVAAGPLSAGQNAGGAHDFDFEIGVWKIHMQRLAHPFTSSNEWTTTDRYSHIVQKVWDGRASLAQLRDDGPPVSYRGLMLRTFDPHQRVWRIYWGSSDDGILDPPLVGRFDGGRGQFFGKSVVSGTTVDVRVTYYDITADSFKTEQALSRDGGKTWETTLKQSFTRSNV